ncbi:acyltransferase family protein [Actinophytocola xanthii]|uniref:acyltransferase family protein n=1 Tax=Actinophytocola xanthii TaxID=1912961 RepID=UPI0018E99316|nr:acyltransferase [Actinophytocola xanthii]
MAARPRLEVLDGLRFLAALAVVAYHFTAMDRVWRRRAEEVFPDQFAFHGWLGVYLFFLISGFVICMSSWGRGVGSFLLSRAVRLYPAYWLSVLVIAVVATTWPYLRPPVEWDAALANLTMFHEPLGQPAVAEVYWTLWAELRFYLLFSLVVWRGLTYRRVVGFCLGWLGLVTVTKALVPDGALPHQVLMTDYAPLFTAGVGFYLMYRFGPTLLCWGIVAGSFLLSVPATVYRAGREAHVGEVVPGWPAVLLLGLCFLLMAAVALGWLSWVRGRWLVVLGATTYPLYLLHLDLGGLLITRLRGSVPAPLLVAAVTAGMIVLAWLVHRYVERPVAPLLRRALLSLSGRLSRRTKADRAATPAAEETPVTASAEPR